MTLRELKEAVCLLAQLPARTEVAVEDNSGELWSIAYLEYELEYDVVVVHLGEKVDK